MKIFINTLKTLLIIVWAVPAFGQVPVPAAPQEGPIMLVGGTIHVGNGTVIENGVIGFSDGNITIVTDVSSSFDRSGYQVVDISGQHVYPGFILPNTRVGLEEVSSIRAMRDYAEEGTINPNVRSLIAYNTDSEIPPTLRFDGILLAEATPSGGTIPGSSSVMEMDGWNWEDAVLKADVAIHLNWPRKMTRRFDQNTFTIKTEPNESYDKVVEELKMHFNDAKSYSNLTNPPVNLKLEAMQGLFDGGKLLAIHANSPKEIVEAVNFAKNYSVPRITIISDESAWYVKEFLKANNISVILPPTHRNPSREDQDYDLPYKLPYLLQEAGLVVALSHEGMLARSRNLPFYAGTAAAYGLTKEEALMTITYNTAKILGIDDRVGTLEQGKDATLFVSEGDALDMRTNILSHAFIKGSQIVLDNKQQELYRRFSKKYGHME